MYKALVALCGALLATGCATIFSGSTQVITFRTVPDRANILVTDREGKQIHFGTTPATLTLKRGAGFFQPQRYTVLVSRQGFVDQTITVSGSLNGWYVANVIFGGLIGLLIVDPATGAMYSLDPDVVEATLQSSGVSVKDEDQSLTIMLAEDVPLSLWQHAVRVDR